MCIWEGNNAQRKERAAQRKSMMQERRELKVRRRKMASIFLERKKESGAEKKEHPLFSRSLTESILFGKANRLKKLQDEWRFEVRCGITNNFCPFPDNLSMKIIKAYFAGELKANFTWKMNGCVRTYQICFASMKQENLLTKRRVSVQLCRVRSEDFARDSGCPMGHEHVGPECGLCPIEELQESRPSGSPRNLVSPFGSQRNYNDYRFSEQRLSLSSTSEIVSL